MGGVGGGVVADPASQRTGLLYSRNPTPSPRNGLDTITEAEGSLGLYGWVAGQERAEFGMVRGSGWNRR